MQRVSLLVLGVIKAEVSGNDVFAVLPDRKKACGCHSELELFLVHCTFASFPPVRGFPVGSGRGNCVVAIAGPRSPWVAPRKYYLT